MGRALEPRSIIQLLAITSKCKTYRRLDLEGESTVVCSMRDHVSKGSKESKREEEDLE